MKIIKPWLWICLSTMCALGVYSCDNTAFWQPPRRLTFSMPIGNEQSLHFVVRTGYNQVYVCRDPKGVKVTGDIVIPEYVEYDSVRYRVVSIDESAFEGCAGITSVSIPKSIASIADRAFYECKGLSYLNFPDSLMYIGKQAFYNCTGLDSIHFPRYLAYIDKVAFFGCKSLAEVVLPSALQVIGGGSFNETGIKFAHMRAVDPPSYPGRAGPFPSGTVLYVRMASRLAYFNKSPWASYLIVGE